MATIYHQVWINAPLVKVYEGISTAEGLGRWWVHHTSVKSDEGLILAHDPGPEHGEVRFKVLDRVKNERVEWEVISGHPSRSPASAWTGTRVVFEISTQDNPGRWRGIQSGVRHMTLLEFRHSGWDENSEFFGFCNFAWGETLITLRNWCEGV